MRPVGYVLDGPAVRVAEPCRQGLAVAAPEIVTGLLDATADGFPSAARKSDLSKADDEAANEPVRANSDTTPPSQGPGPPSGGGAGLPHPKQAQVPSGRLPRSNARQLALGQRHNVGTRVRERSTGRDGRAAMLCRSRNREGRGWPFSFAPAGTTVPLPLWLLLR